MARWWWAAACWFCACAALAARPPAADPGDRLPEAAAALAAEQGADPPDTAARRHATMSMLMGVVGHQVRSTGRRQASVRETQLFSAYEQARDALMGEARRQQRAEPLFEASARYQSDPVFVDSLLARHFTPAEVAQLQGWAAQWRRTMAASLRNAATQRQARALQAAEAQAAAVHRTAGWMLAMALSLLTGGLLWRWIPAVVFDDGDPRRCSIGGRPYRLQVTSGVARGVTKGRETVTHVRGGGPVQVVGNMAYTAPVTSSTTTTVHDRFFIDLGAGRELPVHLRNHDIALRDGQRLTTVMAFAEGRDSGPFLLFHNQATGDTTFLLGAISRLRLPHPWWLVPWALAAGAWAWPWLLQYGHGTAVIGSLIVAAVSLVPGYGLAYAVGIGPVRRFRDELSRRLVTRSA